MKPVLRIEMVSDVSCPWCVIGLGALEQALHSLADELVATVCFEPFELNPDMAAAGEDIEAHLLRKYQAPAAQRAAIGQTLRERGEQFGFTFAQDACSRIWNTFDAHRLLHWAGIAGIPEGEDGSPGTQRKLKWALFRAYFSRGESPASYDVLVAACAQAGLPADAARQILDSERYAAEVRTREALWRDAHDIHAVPAFIIDGRHLIPGGQTSAVFERLLRKISLQHNRETS